ncbi:hypothetical protein ACFL4T_09895 [candidate division KSB1 bacterium]
MRVLRFFLLLIIGIFSSCGKDKTYTIYENSNVKYISNFGKVWNKQIPVELTFIRTIGELNDTNQNYNLYKPEDLEEDQFGNIYIVEMGNKRIQKFSNNGEYILTIGREGQGPGEFQFPVCTGLIDSFLYVFDGENFNIQKFLLIGDFVSSSRTGITKMFLDFEIKDSENFITQYVPVVLPVKISTDPDRNGFLLRSLDFNGVENNAFGITVDYGEWELSNQLNQVTYKIDQKENIYAVYQYINRIEKYNKDGVLLYQSTRKLDYINNSIPKPGSDIPIISMSAGFDSRGLLWVSTFTRYGYEMFLNNQKLRRQNKEPIRENLAESLKIEIFNDNGVLLGEIKQPSFGKIKIIDDKLYIIDDMETMSVSVYKIIEKK